MSGKVVGSINRRAKKIHFCCFTSLDELPKRLHDDGDAVLAAIHKAGRFSVFDISTQKLARTVDRLIASGRLKTSGGAYPWTNVVSNHAGESK